MEKEAAEEEGDHWSSLPELALHSISLRLRSPAYFTTLCGVCRSWRSAISSSDFISSIPPLILLFPRYTSSAAASFYSLSDDAIYDSPSIPSFQTLAFFGQSNGFLLALDDSTGSIPSIADPLSGLRFDFPSMINPVFLFAILTAPPSSPKSQLVLFRRDSLLFCPVGGSRWTLHYFPAFRDAIFYRDRLYLTHVVEGYQHNNMRVRVVEYDLEVKTKRQIFSGRSGLLVESSEEELLMVFKEQDMLVGFELLPRTGKGGQTDWPRGGERSLFLGCQRSDLSSSCLTGSIMRKYGIHSASFFWRNYLALSQLRSNGFYVIVDAHGRAEVSKIQPNEYLLIGGMSEGGNSQGRRRGSRSSSTQNIDLGPAPAEVHPAIAGLRGSHRAAHPDEITSTKVGKSRRRG